MTHNPSFGAAASPARAGNTPAARRTLDPIRDLGITVHFREEFGVNGGEYRAATVARIGGLGPDGYPVLALHIFGVDEAYVRPVVQHGALPGQWLFAEDRTNPDTGRGAA